MAKLVEEPYSKENMKMAMLNHERTFRHQVYELHRLYRIQKVLMKNITENRGKTETWAVKNEEEEEEGEEEEEEGGEINFIEESEIELTLGPSSYSNQIGRRTRMKKLGEIKGASDSGMSFSSSSSTTGSAHKSRAFYRDGEFAGGSPMGFVGFLEVEDQMRLSQHHHPPNPWLYQVVSLNLT